MAACRSSLAVLTVAACGTCASVAPAAVLPVTAIPTVELRQGSLHEPAAFLGGCILVADVAGRSCGTQPAGPPVDDGPPPPIARGRIDPDRPVLVHTSVAMATLTASLTAPGRIDDVPLSLTRVTSLTWRLASPLRVRQLPARVALAGRWDRGSTAAFSAYVAKPWLTGSRPRVEERAVTIELRTSVPRTATLTVVAQGHRRTGPRRVAVGPRRRTIRLPVPARAADAVRRGAVVRVALRWQHDRASSVREFRLHPRIAPSDAPPKRTHLGSGSESIR